MKRTFESLFDRIFGRPAPLPPGIYTYQSPPEVQPPYRMHLRIDPGSDSLLILNASTVLHLNQTAAEYAYHLIQQTPAEQVARLIARRYQISAAKAANDFRDFQERLHTLIETPDLDPETFLDFERVDPYASALTAPYRLDCALTYRLSEGFSPDLAPTARVTRELLTQEWKTILDKAWQAGIPHIIFTGGEPTLRPDLPELIAHAEKLGQVTGLLSDGQRLCKPTYLQQVLQSGLDHLMLILDPSSETAWEALRDTLAEDLFVTVHLTLTPNNQANMEELIRKLHQMNVHSLSLSASSPELRPALNDLRDLAFLLGLSLTWDLPVPYSSFHPLSLELSEGETPVQGAGRAWLYVEPDGDVLPAQGIEEVLGNLLKDDWVAIWQKARARL
ncbi:MAG: radical SAM protein [Anaerolinea sp.]|nr:radical SAM protein [Anaerolinea sp.]